MPDKEAMISAIETHCRALTGHDRQQWLGIWTDDAVLEDPVGVDTFCGIEELGTTFWSLVELTSPMRLGLEQDVIVCGNEAIAILSASASWQGAQRDVGPLVDHFTFAPDGKIAAMRAYWHFARHGYRPEMDTAPAVRERMIAAIATHCRAESEGDKDAWVKLFADDIVIEDPVGSGNVHRGIDAVSTGFWSQARAASPKVRQTAEPIVCGSEAMAFFEAQIVHGGEPVTISPIVAQFVFNEEAKVVSLRAFFAY